MTRLLETYLEIANAGNHESKTLIEKSIPRRLGHIEPDGKLYDVRELLLSSAIESTTLIHTEVMATALEGAQPAISIRNALPIYTMTKGTKDIPKRPAGRYAPKVAEGAEIPIKNGDYGKVTLTAEKYAERPLITNELIDDGDFDVIAMEIQDAGRAVENSFNQDGLTECLDGATLEHDTAGSNQGIKAVASGITAMKDADYQPTDIILSPEAEGMLMKEFVPTAYVGAEAAMSGNLPQLMGLNVHSCNVTDVSDTYTWGYAADGEIGMLILDKSKSCAFGMRKDISVTKYNDPIRDLQGMSIIGRADFKTMQAKAILRVEY